MDNKNQRLFTNIRKSSIGKASIWNANSRHFLIIFAATLFVATVLVASCLAIASPVSATDKPVEIDVSTDAEKSEKTVQLISTLPSASTDFVIDDVVNTVGNSVKTEKAVEVIQPTQEPVKVMHFDENDVIVVAKILYNECGGVPSKTEQACVAWTICNRVDAGYGSTISECGTSPYQYAYNEDTVVTDDLYNLAYDVLTRWNNEKNGEDNVGRVIPKDYVFFWGDGEHNWFRNAFEGGTIWDYSFASPYEN